MEIRVYKDGENKKLDLRGTSINSVLTVDKFTDVYAKASNGKIDIYVGDERRFQGVDPSDIKDFSGAVIESNVSKAAFALNAILFSNKEVDSYVIGDDLSQKSSETIFTHNKAGTSGLGGRLIVDDENAKVNVTRNAGQGTTGLEVSVTGVSGSDLGSIVGKGNYSNATRTIFTAEAATGQLYDSLFTVHDRFEVEGEANFLDSININGNELSITDLDKVPSSLGSAGQVLAVNSGGTALEFVPQSGGGGGGSSTLIGLTDTPSSFSSAGQVLVVNAARNAMEFATPLEIGTTSTTALAGDTTTITTSQALQIASNTSKVSFPGFGTTSGTALEGDTSLFSGAYADLTGAPTIPTNNNQLTNGAGYITGYTVVESDVTQHQAALSITESQISDLGTYLTSVAFSDLTSTPTTLAGYGITDSLQIGTTSTTALAGNTTTITTSQASEITANTAKTSFPGFGTTAGTALEGNTTLFDGAYSSLTGTPTIPTNNNQLTNGAGYIGSVVDDTTPQLGGNLDVNSNEIQSNGDLVVRVDADNNTANSSFIVKNGAGLNMLALDEEGMTSITTGADNPLKLGNLDGGTSTFNCVSLNGSTAYPGLIGFAAGSNSNDNFFMMGEIIDLRPDTSNPITGAIRLQPDPNNAGESVCTINHRSGSEPTTHALAVRGTALISDDVDLSAALDVTGTLTASGLTYPTTDGTNGQVLSTNGLGTLSFVDAGTGGGGGSTPMEINYARLRMGSTVLLGGANQQNFDSASYVVAKFDVEEDNDGTQLTSDTVTDNKITVASDGLYRLSTAITFNATVARVTPSVSFNINQTRIIGEAYGYIRASSGQNENACNLTRVIALSAGDEIQVCAHDTSTVSGSCFAVEAIFEVEKLGGSVKQQTLEGTYLEVVTRDSPYTSGDYEGKVIKFGTGTLSAGKIYVLRDNAGAALWDEADADAEIQTKGLLGMALGTSPTTDGLLVRGISTLSNSFTVGAPLYISLTSGTMTDDLSSHTTGDFVRAIGYALSTQLVYLDPSPDYIELA